MQHHRIVDARAQRPQRGTQPALRLRPVERRLGARRELQRGVEAGHRIGDAGDVLRRLALGQQDLGLRDRLAPGFVATHFSARISAKVSFAVSSASRISGTPT